MSRLYKPPRPVQVEVDGKGRPVAIVWRGARHCGRACRRRLIRAGQAGEQIERVLYLWEGKELLCELYWDRMHGGWYMLRVYD